MSDLDFSNASAQTGDLIPAGTVARLRMTIRAGNAGPGGWLTRSRSSDAIYISAEFTVMDGPAAKRKFWGNMTVDGGKRDETGRSLAAEITRATLRAILESARGIMPRDESPQAQAARRVPDYGAFDGIEFVGRVGVEPGKDGYKDKNKLDVVITPDKPQWKEHSDSVATATTTAAPVAAAATAATSAVPAWLK